MTCQEIQLLIGDMARGSLMDAAESAEDHLSTCQHCSRRLADEQALSAGLRTLAATTKGKQASSNLEARLLSAFAEHHAPKRMPKRAGTPAAASRWRRYWPLALATSVTIAVSIGSVWYRNAGTSRGENTATPVGANLRDSDEKKTAEQTAANSERRSNSGVKIINADRKKPSDKMRNARRASAPANSIVAANEIATRYFPLTYTDDGLQLENGQLVRVEMPRVTLLSFGLPMNLERAREPIKADILLGNDGIARAIRFVQ